MRRRYRIMPCPRCDRDSRVWSFDSQSWECPDCQWDNATRNKAMRRIEQARERWAGNVVPE